MIKIFICFGFLIYMFLSTTVAAHIGINMVGTASMVFFSIPILKGFLFEKKKIFSARFNREWQILSLGLIILLTKVIIGDYAAVKGALFFVVFPILLFIVLSYQSPRLKQILVHLIILFFISECFLAIYEKIEGINIFPYLEGSVAEARIRNGYEFRSTAFLGHPLMNAQVVSIITGFILISRFQTFHKVSLFFLGLTAILCFNARGAILIWIIIGGIFFYRILKTKSFGKGTVPLFFTVAIIGVSFFYNIITELDFGSRFFENKIFDGSAQARLDVLNAFSFVSNSDLIFGNSSNYLYVTDQLGAAGVENSYIVIILEYGLLAFVFFMLTYYTWLKKILKDLNHYQRIVILLSFIIVGSSNNSLAAATPWMFFIFCMTSFPVTREEQEVSETSFQMSKRAYPIN